MIFGEIALICRRSRYVGSGATAIKYFCFGPEYQFPVRAQKRPVVCMRGIALDMCSSCNSDGCCCVVAIVLTHRAFDHQGNCYSEREYLPDIFAGMQMAHGLIAKADDLLWTGRRAPAAVAMLSPRSAYVWDTAAVTQDGQIQIWENMTQFKADYEAELWGIYTALTTHSAVPIDFVDEDGLTEDTLKQYKLLLVTAPNVPSENLHAVTRWIQAGGTLLTTAGAARFDRYDSPDSTVQDASGVEELPRERQLLDGSFAAGSRWMSSHSTRIY